MPYTDHLRDDDMDRLLGETTGPCVSVYLPTSPVTQHTDKDRITLKNLRGEAFDRLQDQGVGRSDAEAILLPVDDILEDDGFWPYLSDGLAIFSSPRTHAVYRLPLSPAPSVGVGERFILKPLIPLLTEDGLFHIIAVSQDEVRLFEGTRHHVSEVHLDTLPGNIADALRMRGREPGRGPLRRWQGDEGQKLLYRKFFLQIDRALRPYYGSHSDPLVLAGVDYLFPIFREACSYRHLAEEAIVGNPEHLTAADLHAKAWPIVEPIFARPRREALETYRALQGTGRTSDDLETILGAALDGRVATLFVSLRAEPFGTFDPAARTAEVRDAPQPGDVDLAAQAARWAYGTGAEIFGGEPPDIPEGGPVAAVFRYA